MQVNDFSEKREIEDLYDKYREIERKQELLRKELDELEIHKTRIKEQLKTMQTDEMIGEKLELLYSQRQEKMKKQKR